MSSRPHGADRPRTPTLDDLPSMREFGVRLAAVDERAVARGRRGATTLAALLGAVLALAGFTGAAAVALTAATGSPVPSFARGDDTGIFPAAGTSRISDVRSPDPSSGPPWTVRLGRSKGGLVCVGAGQVDGSRFGIRGTDGRFRPTPPVGNDACGPAPTPSSPVVAMRGFSGPRTGAPAGATTVVYGSGGAGLRTVTVRTGDGRLRSVAVGRAGTFVLAVPGWPEGVAPVVDLRWSGGRDRTVRLGLPDGSVPDPSGTFAWSNDAIFRVHVHGRSSPRGCLYLTPVRVELGEHGPLICLPDDSRTAVIQQVRSPVGNRLRTVVAVQAGKGERVSVRVGPRTYPVLAAMTAADPQRSTRVRGGRREVVRRPAAATGPRAALAVLPAGVAPADLHLRVLSGGRNVPITVVRGADR